MLNARHCFEIQKKGFMQPIKLPLRAHCDLIGTVCNIGQCKKNINLNESRLIKVQIYIKVTIHTIRFFQFSLFVSTKIEDDS